VAPGVQKVIYTVTVSVRAGMAELADALDLGSSAVKGVQVQVLFPAPPHAASASRESGPSRL
jgi:hypothetical protein